MRRLMRRRVAAAGIAALLWVGLASAGAAVDLEGSWHVLVHYTDSSAANPDAERWDDRVWMFERQGDRLRWIEYPIVIFDDESGRFERAGTNRASRVLHFWEPDAGQLAEIRRGLQFNPRGARNKSLRGSDAKGWSTGGGGAYQSARFLSYTELWQVKGPPDKPVFRHEDVLGGATAETLDGVTLWQTEEASENLLTGRFERDGTRKGRFFMRRSGSPEKVRGSGKSQNERVAEMFYDQMAGQLGGLPTGARTDEAALRQMIEAGEVPDDVRAEVNERLRSLIEDHYRDQGNDPRPWQPQIEKLADKMERLYLDEGKSSEEIAEMLKKGELRP